MNKITLHLTQKLSLFSTVFVMCIILLSGSVNAVDPPLSNGCYKSENSSFTLVQCPVPYSQNPSGCVLVALDGDGNPVGSGSQDIDCQTGEASNSITPASNNQNTDTDRPDINVNINLDENGNPITSGGDHYCGSKGGEGIVKISFDIGCLGPGYGRDINPILDMAFALLRFLSVGVGIIVTGSIVWAGIQYSISRGDPKMTEQSIKRISNSVIALLIYIFSFAILNFIVPGGLFL